MTEKRCLIISGGEYAELPPDAHPFPYVIACDRGYLYAARLGITPDLIVGDFDSARKPTGEIPVLAYPVEKDDTDTMLAIRHALEKGYRDIAICCAYGGRFDHTLANLQSGAFIAQHGGVAHIYGADVETIVFREGAISVPRQENASLSVFAVSERCENVMIHGTKYTCENETLTNTFPLGASNSWAGDAAEISVGSGMLMVVISKMM